MDLALYQPEIPQNLGTLLRTAACFNFNVHIIKPCGFPLSDAKLKRSGMDYSTAVKTTVHDSYEDFQSICAPQRLILLSTNATQSYKEFVFQDLDILMVGREADGVPEAVEDAIPHRLLIPMHVGFRSLNVAIAAGIVMAEMRHQQQERDGR